MNTNCQTPLCSTAKANLEAPLTSSSNSNAHEGLIRCHHCSQQLKHNQLAKCQAHECLASFCKKCLTKSYKYSKAAAKELPTTTWKCPKCMQRCKCSKYKLRNNLLRCHTIERKEANKQRNIVQKGAALRRELVDLANQKVEEPIRPQGISG